MIGAAVLAYTVLWWFHERTRWGSIVRAVVDKPEIAEGLGINTSIVAQGVFGLGLFWQVLQEFSDVPSRPFTPAWTSGTSLAFVVVILGGMGSLKERQ